MPPHIAFLGGDAFPSIMSITLIVRNQAPSKSDNAAMMTIDEINNPTDSRSIWVPRSIQATIEAPQSKAANQQIEE
jgi:hypothetical protein